MKKRRKIPTVPMSRLVYITLKHKTLSLYIREACLGGYQSASTTYLVDKMRRHILADRLVGLVVKASASRAEDLGSESRLRRDFFGVESCQ